jgi:hypothetical protein
MSTPPATGSTGKGPAAAAGADAAASAAGPFERTGNKNRASERYHIPHKKAAKEQGGGPAKQEEDKENFATPETPRYIEINQSIKKMVIFNSFVLYLECQRWVSAAVMSLTTIHSHPLALWIQVRQPVLRSRSIFVDL